MERHRIAEAIRFFLKKGPLYVKDLATDEERKYFSGILYKKDGTADKEKIESLIKQAA